MTTTIGPKVSEKTKAAALRRMLARDGLVLRKSRPVDVPSQGDWYISDASTNSVVRHDVDIKTEIEARRPG